MRICFNYILKMKRFALLTLFILLCSSIYVNAQLTGTVFRDYNGNGLRDSTATYKEPFVTGDSVKVFGTNGLQIATTKVTGANGTYSFTAAEIPANTAVRVEFSAYSAVDFPSFSGTGNGTNVQFVTAGAAATANFAINAPEDFWRNSNDATGLVVNNRRGTLTGYSQGKFNVLQIKNSTTTVGTPAASNEVTIDTSRRPSMHIQTGSLFGLASQRKQKRFFASAALKRDVDLGPKGTSGIYIFDLNSGNYTLTGGFSLQGVVPSNSATALDFGTVTRSTTSSNDNFLTNTSGTPSRDIDASNKAGKTAFGDIEADPGTDTVYMVNLNQRNLIVFNASAASSTLVSASAATLGSLIKVYDIPSLAGMPAPAATGDIIRPYAVKIYKGVGYLGVVSDASSSKNIANLKGYIVRFDPKNITAGVTVVASINFSNFEPFWASAGSDRWHPWTNTYSDATGNAGHNSDLTVIYAQPMIASIEFNEDESMNIGIRDRWGDQGGNFAYIPVSGTSTTTQTVSQGDLLHACKVGTTWVLEGTAGSCDQPAANLEPSPLYTTNTTNNFGNGSSYQQTGKEWYADRAGDGNAECFEGGGSKLMGSYKIISTVFSPVNAGGNTSGTNNWSTQGMQWNDVNTGLKTQIARTNGDDGNLDKCATMGDVEMMLDPAPIQIGNRIWLDNNNNGIQDAGEVTPGVPASTTITLRSPGVDGIYGTADDQTWTTTTTATGNYYFDSSNVSGDNRKPATWKSNYGILPGYDYRIELAIPALEKLTATDTGSNNNIDNDARLSGTLAIIPVNTLVTDHSMDIGFQQMIPISGVVWDDGNGDATKAGAEVFTNAGGLNAVLTDVNGKVIQVVAVNASTGAYSFDQAIANNSYKVLLTTSTPAVGSTLLSSSLPATGAIWNNTGVNLGGTANTANQTGIISISTGTTAITNQNFGIEQLPVAVGSTLASQLNPGGTQNIVITNNFPSTDADGTVGTININSFPSFVTSITVGTTTYYASAASIPGTCPTASCLAFPTTGGVNVAATSGVPNSVISIDPINGAVTPVIPYTVTDNAGKLSPAPANVTVPFTDLILSGKVYDDGNGVSNSLIDGTLISAAGANALYANLVNASTGNVVGSTPLVSGTYTFNTSTGLEGNKNFNVVLSTVAGITGSTTGATSTLTSNWVSTAEGSGLGDGTPNGLLLVSMAGSSITTGADFGIEQLPVAVGSTLAAQLNPGGTQNVTITNNFPSTDADGTVGTININSFPTFVTSITVGTTTYYASAAAIPGTCPTATCLAFPASGGVNVPATSGVPNTAISIDPVNGAVTPVIPYTVTDNAGKLSAAPANVNVPFTDLSLSGKVYDDGNGTTNSLIDGTLISAAGANPLYANLVNATTGNVVGSVTISGGNYSFNTGTGLEINKNYNVVLSTVAGVVGTTTGATSTLTPNWVSTADGAGTGDGTPNGLVLVPVGTTSITTGADFGIEQLPVAVGSTLASRVNPGGTQNVIITNNFPSTDADGTVGNVNINSFPSFVTSITVGTTTYYATAAAIPGTCPTASCLAFPASGGVNVPATSGVPNSAISIDPVNGAVTPVIPYTVTDNAGKLSPAPANVSVPFTDLILSGKVYDDGNGTTNSLIDGTLISAAGTSALFANLVNVSTGKVVSVNAVTGGGYSFNTSTGLEANTNFNVVLSTTAGIVGSTTGASSTLTANWVPTAEGSGLGDGTPNGLLPVAMANNSITTGADFGIEQLPIAVGSILPTQVNPGGTQNITITNNFPSTDADGTVGNININSFPTNVTSITVGTTTYYASVGVIPGTCPTANCLAFPVSGGVNIPATSGVPNLPITIDPINGPVTPLIPYTVTDNAGLISAAPANVVVPLVDLLLTGNVYDDANGTTNSLIDGTMISSAGTNTLFANLVNPTTGNVISVSAVLSGVYTFNTSLGLEMNKTFNVVLSIVQGVVGTTTGTTSALTSNWVSTAEGAGSGDGTPNGMLVVPVATASITTGEDFGIEQLPIAIGSTLVSQVNPGGTQNVTITNNFPSTDADGTVGNININSFPSNVTSIAVGTTTYYATAAAIPGTCPTATCLAFPISGGVNVPATSGVPNSAISIDPINGAVTAVIPYTVTDNAGKLSAAPANVSVPFTDLILSGKVYDDGNGTTNSLIDGTLISAAGANALYANLVKVSTGKVVGSVPVTSGSYSINTVSGLEANTNFNVVLSTIAGVTGSTTGATSTLTSNWVSTAEGSGLGDGTANGLLLVPVGTTNITTGTDFGIEQLPIAVGSSLASQVNPGGTQNITITNNFPSTDADGTVGNININSFPTNVTSITVGTTTYYANAGSLPGTCPTATCLAFPASGGVNVPATSGVPNSAISIDPVSGAVTAVIPYTVTDNAGKLSAAPANVTVPFTDLILSGKVYDDGNGTTNSLIDGTLISAAGANPLYVNLVNVTTGKVVSSVTVSSGNYTFNTNTGLEANTNFNVVVSTVPGISGTTTGATSTLTTNWVSTAEGAGLGDGTPNGLLNVPVGLTSITTGADFGIEQLPVAIGSTLASQVNPGGTQNVTITNNFPSTDADGTVGNININSFPTNVTSITVGTTTYYATVAAIPGTCPTATCLAFPVSGGVNVPATSGVPNAAISIDPINGSLTAVIPYTVTDNAGKLSAAPANVNVPFTDLILSGKVYDDGNGTTNSLIDGTLISAAGVNALYANLVNATTGKVVGSVPVTGGNYGLNTSTGLEANTNFNVVLSTVAGVIGTTTGASSSLTSNWVSTAEGAGLGDGTPNGLLAVPVGITNITSGADFGMEQLPVAIGSTLASQLNPGGTQNVTITNNFPSTDADGTVGIININSFPSNVTSIAVGTTTYYANVASIPGTCPTATCLAFPATGGVNLPATSGVPNAAITIDPINGAVTAVIPYTITDNAGKLSAAPANVNVPFTDLILSGKVYDDGNGTTNSLIDGTLISASGANPLYANLVNPVSGNVIGTVPVSAGTYTFNTSTGLQENTNYNVVLSTVAGVTGTTTGATSSLTSNWVSTAEGTGLGDGTPNGLLFVPVTTSSITTGTDFGIEQLPIAIGSTLASRANPGGTQNVTITNNFPSTDADGTVGNININSFPTFVTSITVGTTTYYPNAASIPGTCPTATCLAFPATGGVNVPATSGVPNSVISIDPINGAVTPVIPYTVTDNAGKLCAAPANVIVPFTDLILSGKVYDDANGTTNSLIDGTLISVAATSGLFANLVNVSTGKVVAVTAISGGAYSFNTGTGLEANTNYNVVLSTIAGIVGTTTGTSSALPTNWVSTAEGAALGDGTPNGLLNVPVASTSITTGADFGIEQLPIALGFIVPTQLNPGGTQNIIITNNFPSTDADGTVGILNINSFPTNVTSIAIGTTTYYANVAAIPGTCPTASCLAFPTTGGVNVPATSGVPNLAITIDPINGPVTPIIPYTVTDNANLLCAAPANVVVPLTDLLLSGKVYDDGNGTTNSLIDGTLINAAGVNALYANLVSPITGKVISVSAVLSGVYTFNTSLGLEMNKNFDVVLSTVQGVVGTSTGTTSTLTTNWVSTADGSGLGDGTPNGFLVVPIVTNSVTSGADFGIEQLPIAVGSSLASQVNPGGTQNVSITNNFPSTDADGTVGNININSFPTNVTSIAVGTTTYYASVAAIPGTCPTASCLAFPASGGVNVPATSGVPNLAISIDPINGAVTSVIPYTVTDNALQLSAAPANVTVPFTDLILSGKVYDDANGTSNSLIDGTLISAAGANALYANLVNASSGKVVNTTPVTSGAYSFNTSAGLEANTNFNVVLSTVAGVIGTSTGTSSTLTSNWVSTAEGSGLGDGTPNGLLLVPVASNSITTGADFGIEQLPFASILTAAVQRNPGGTISAPVAATTFSATDADGTVTGIRLSGFPTFANSITVGTTTYYATAAAIPGTCPTATCAVFPVSGVSVTTNALGQPTTSILVDPVSGTVTVGIPYFSVDNAGKESVAAGLANAPFYAPLPPIAQDIDNAPINNSAAQTHIGAFVASDPQGDPILSYTVLTLPPPTTGILYTCSTNTVPCTGTYSPVTLGQILTPAQSSTLYFDPLNSYIGTTTFNYNATSQNGTSNTAVETIPVFNNPPTANSFTTSAVMVNSSNNKLPSLSGADGDGTVVSYTVTPPSSTQGSITYCTTPPSTGCGTPITTPTVLTPAQISTIYFTPTHNFTGTATFTYTTTDNNNLVSTPATVGIPVTPLGLTPQLLPPVTQDVTIEPLNSNAGNTLISPLIGTDPDGVVVSYQLLSIPSASTGVLSYCTTGNYPCTGTLTPVVVNQVLTPAQALTLQFDPAAGNNAPASFTYNATDNSSLLSNTSTYTIPIINLPPTAVTVQEAVPFNTSNYPVPALQGFDVDGVVVNYTITAVPNTVTQGKLFTCSSNTVPCTGTYTQVNASDVLTPAQIGSLTFTPVTGFTGLANGTYTVTDNNGNVSQPAQILLKVDNFNIIGLPPVAVGSSVTMSANAGLSPLPTNFISATDPDGTIANFTITSLPPASQGVYTYCTAPPSTGCNTPVTVGLVMTPAQAAKLSFTPNQTYTGPAYLGFYATDNSGNVSNLANSIVNVYSLPPIATGYTTAAVKNGGAPISTPLLASDPLDNGTVVSYTIVSIPTSGNGTITYCINPPSSGCNTPIVVGTVLTPAQAATVSYTPGTNMTVHEVTFDFSVIDNSNNLSNVATIVVPRIDPMPCINVRAYLEGALMNNASAVAPDGRPLMRDNLRSSPFNGLNYIPVQDPYEFATTHVNVVSKYTKLAPQTSSYPIFQQVTDSATVFGVTGQNAIVDWAFVELRSKSNNATVLATRAGLIQRDGDIVDVDGASCLSFPGVAIDSYYVAVRHRDHLGMMTKYGQSASSLQNLVDMTLATTPMYDFGTSLSTFDYTGLATNNNVKAGYRAMWAGDFNADKKVKFDNPAGDDNQLLFDVINDAGNTNHFTNYNFSFGYWQGDFNMDSKDKYDNPSGDDNLLLFQEINYPLNTGHFTNFNFFLQQLP